MITKLNKISKMAAVILIITNFIVMVFCILLFSFGLWIISSSNTLSFVVQNFGGKTLNALLPSRVLTVEVGIAVSTVAMVVFFIAYMGLYGAVTKSQFLLFMYATIIFLMLLLECALMYYFSSNLVEKGLLEQDGQWTHALRLSFKCCDFNRTRTQYQNPPWSCCGVDFYPQNCTLPNIYQKDCQTTISHWLDHYQSAVYTSLVALHVILLSCSIVRRNKDR